MGPAPQLSTYQNAAQSIYEPAKQAEATQIRATNATTKNSLEAEKGQVVTDYQSAIDKLTQSVQDESAQIAQTYNERLSGNFSGLQGNDMGKMFARANETQGIIEQTRANKLAQITAGETNADITMNADLAALAPKYQSEEAKYAQGAYATAVKDYNDTNYKNAQLELSRERLGIESQRLANDQNSKIADQYKATGKSTYVTSPNGNQVKNTSTSNGYEFTGPGGRPVNMAEYVAGRNGGSVNVNDVLDLLQNGSEYDRQIYRQVQASGLSDPTKILDLIAQEDKKNYYGFGG